MWKAAAAALLLAGCGDTQREGSDPQVPPPLDDAAASYDYELDLPPKFVRDPSAHGIDSKAELWRAPGVEIGSDFGMYSGAPSCAAGQRHCSVTRETVDGRPALLGRARFGPGDARAPYFVHLHLPVLERPYELKLNLFAHCQTEAACDEALALFRRVRIVRRGES